MTGTRRPTRALLTLPLLLGVAIPALGQDDDLPTQLWLAFQHHHKVGEKTRVSGKLGYKELTSPDQVFGEWNEFYVNGDGSYDLGEQFRVDGGVGLYYTYQPEDDDTFEFRLTPSSQGPSTSRWRRSSSLTSPARSRNSLATREDCRLGSATS
jgi:hypothetical protein